MDSLGSCLGFSAEQANSTDLDTPNPRNENVCSLVHAVLSASSSSKTKKSMLWTITRARCADAAQAPDGIRLAAVLQEALLDERWRRAKPAVWRELTQQRIPGNMRQHRNTALHVPLHVPLDSSRADLNDGLTGTAASPSRLDLDAFFTRLGADPLLLSMSAPMARVRPSHNATTTFALYMIASWRVVVGPLSARLEVLSSEQSTLQQALQSHSRSIDTQQECVTALQRKAFTVDSLCASLGRSQTQQATKLAELEATLEQQLVQLIALHGFHESSTGQSTLQPALQANTSSIETLGEKISTIQDEMASSCNDLVDCFESHSESLKEIQEKLDLLDSKASNLADLTKDFDMDKVQEKLNELDDKATHLADVAKDLDMAISGLDDRIVICESMSQLSERKGNDASSSARKGKDTGRMCKGGKLRKLAKDFDMFLQQPQQQRENAKGKPGKVTGFLGSDRLSDKGKGEHFGKRPRPSLSSPTCEPQTQVCVYHGRPRTMINFMRDHAGRFVCNPDSPCIVRR